VNYSGTETTHYNPLLDLRRHHVTLAQPPQHPEAHVSFPPSSKPCHSAMPRLIRALFQPDCSVLHCFRGRHLRDAIRLHRGRISKVAPIQTRDRVLGARRRLPTQSGTGYTGMRINNINSIIHSVRDIVCKVMW
jgi:hypothetical protein